MARFFYFQIKVFAFYKMNSLRFIFEYSLANQSEPLFYDYFHWC